MFIVTNDGVIATDPVGYGRPQGGATYLAEIRKVTCQPIRYLVYSHHHFDHIAGGRAFKEAGARVVAHRRAKERLEVLNDPNTVLPDETIDKRRTHHARGHGAGADLHRPEPFGQHAGHAAAEGADRLRRRSAAGRAGAGPRHDRLLSAQAEESIKQIIAMDWERLIPGHPGGGRTTGHEEGRRRISSRSCRTLPRP